MEEKGLNFFESLYFIYAKRKRSCAMCSIYHEDRSVAGNSLRLFHRVISVRQYIILMKHEIIAELYKGDHYQKIRFRAECYFNFRSNGFKASASLYRNREITDFLSRQKPRFGHCD